jgi:hypothetical protein
MVSIVSSPCDDEYRQLPASETFQLPVVALSNATEEMVGQIFVAINVNQKPVNRDLLTQMKAILGLLETDIEKTAIELIHALDEDKQSPLLSRVLRFPKEKNKWIKGKSIGARCNWLPRSWRVLVWKEQC